jgi:arginyl-tRNA synthetase
MVSIRVKMMIKEEISRFLKEILGVEDVPFNVPPKKEIGDFSSAICLAVAKQKRRKPMEIAQETAEKLKATPTAYISEVTITPPGYLNFKVRWPDLARDLISQIFEKERLFGQPAGIEREKVFIEHTSVNPNKAMHIGHLRNAVLGDTVARILKWAGFRTETCNYIDDTGLQVVDVVTALLYLDPPLYDERSSSFDAIWAKAPSDIPFDYFCWDLYARFHMEIENSAHLGEKREEVLRRIEGGADPVAYFAKELSTRIVRAHIGTVAPLSIFYDLLNWESDIIGSGFWAATFELLKTKGVIRFETEGPNQGCWVVPFGGVVDTGEGVKSLDKILVRSNGSVTYTGKDIAYQLWKFGLLDKDFFYKPWGVQANGEMLWTTAKERDPEKSPSHRFGHAKRVINVIDTRQSYPQQVILECFRQMGLGEQADRSIHLAYEVVNLSSQAARTLGMEETEEKKAVAMSGRSGTGVKAKDFIRMVKQKVIEKADHPPEEGVASSLASAAIRYYLLKFTLESQIIFDFDEALKTTGDTGVYLEYAHARACSILRKAGEKMIDVQWREDSVPGQMTETERNLLNALAAFPSLVGKVSNTLRVSQMTEYAFNLATSFTDFYEHPDPGADAQIPFIHLEDPGLRTFRLSLVRAFRDVMGIALSLLGMPALERI